MNLKEVVLRGESEILEFKESLQLKDEIGDTNQRISSSEIRRLDIIPTISVGEALERLDLMKNSKLTNTAVLLFGKNPQKFLLQLLGVSKSTLLRIFKSLEERGLIKKYGKGKNIYYVLV